MAALGLLCCVGFPLVTASGGYSLVSVRRFLIAVASPAAEPGLKGMLSCPIAHGIFPDQGSNPCLLYCQADSLPLYVLRLVMSNSLQHQGVQPARLLWPWGFSRQEYWSGLPYLPPGGLPNPGLSHCIALIVIIRVTGLPRGSKPGRRGPHAS